MRYFIVLAGIVLLSACGFNLYTDFASDDTDQHRMTAAKNFIDNKDYENAEKELDKIDRNSKEKVLLQVSAKLGKAGLSLWDILLDAVENSSSGTQGSSGVEKVFNLFTDSFFGSGEVRQNRLNALDESVLLLKSVSSSGDKLDNLRCFLTGIYILPIVNDGAAAMTAINSTLQNIADQVAGTGTSASECSGLNDFQSAMDSLGNVQQGMLFILEQISGCQLLDFLNNSSAVNEIASRAKTFTETADKGCPELNCTGAICQALNLPCVSDLINTTGATADNGRVETCEIIYNCKDGGCF